MHSLALVLAILSGCVSSGKGSKSKNNKQKIFCTVKDTIKKKKKKEKKRQPTE